MVQKKKKNFHPILLNMLDVGSKGIKAISTDFVLRFSDYANRLQPDEWNQNLAAFGALMQEDKSEIKICFDANLDYSPNSYNDFGELVNTLAFSLNYLFSELPYHTLFTSEKKRISCLEQEVIETKLESLVLKDEELIFLESIVERAYYKFSIQSFGPSGAFLELSLSAYENFNDSPWKLEIELHLENEAMDIFGNHIPSAIVFLEKLFELTFYLLKIDEEKERNFPLFNIILHKFFVAKSISQ